VLLLQVIADLLVESLSHHVDHIKSRQLLAQRSRLSRGRR